MSLANGHHRTLLTKNDTNGKAYQCSKRVPQWGQLPVLKPPLESDRCGSLPHRSLDHLSSTSPPTSSDPKIIMDEKLWLPPPLKKPPCHTQSNQRASDIGWYICPRWANDLEQAVRIYRAWKERLQTYPRQPLPPALHPDPRLHWCLCPSQMPSEDKTQHQGHSCSFRCVSWRCMRPHRLLRVIMSVNLFPYRMSSGLWHRDRECSFAITPPPRLAVTVRLWGGLSDKPQHDDPGDQRCLPDFWLLGWPLPSLPVSSLKSVRGQGGGGWGVRETSLSGGLFSSSRWIKTVRFFNHSLERASGRVHRNRIPLFSATERQFWLFPVSVVFQTIFFY